MFGQDGHTDTQVQPFVGGSAQSIVERLAAEINRVFAQVLGSHRPAEHFTLEQIACLSRDNFALVHAVADNKRDAARATNALNYNIDVCYTGEDVYYCRDADVCVRGVDAVTFAKWCEQHNIAHSGLYEVAADENKNEITFEYILGSDTPEIAESIIAYILKLLDNERVVADMRARRIIFAGKPRMVESDFIWPEFLSLLPGEIRTRLMATSSIFKEGLIYYLTLANSSSQATIAAALRAV
jgi:hypothetical protein